MQQQTLEWPKEGNARVPYRVFADPEIYRAELDRIFLGPTWQCLGVAAELPNFLELTVESAEPGVRGDTANNVTKPATLETGTVINVPLFVNPGDKIRIDTRTGQYASRVK